VPLFKIIILERSYDDIEGKLDEYMSNQHIFLSTPCGINADTSNEYVSPGGHFRKTGSNQSFPYDSLPLLYRIQRAWWLGVFVEHYRRGSTKTSSASAHIWPRE